MNAPILDELFLDFESGPFAYTSGMPTMTQDICMTIRIGSGPSFCVADIPMSALTAKTISNAAACGSDLRTTRTASQKWCRELLRSFLRDLPADAGDSGLTGSSSRGINTSPYTDITPVTPVIDLYV